MGFKFVILWTDVALWALFAGLIGYGFRVLRHDTLRATWGRVLRDAPALCSSLVLLLFVGVGSKKLRAFGLTLGCDQRPAEMYAVERSDAEKPQQHQRRAQRRRIAQHPAPGGAQGVVAQHPKAVADQPGKQRPQRHIGPEDDKLEAHDD